MSDETYLPSAIERSAEVVSGRWTMPIICTLLSGAKRYSELKAAMPKVSPRMLSKRLKMLAAEGMLTRTLTASVPPRTDYRLTAKGRQLAPIVRAMEAHGAALLEAEEARRQADSSLQGELF